jgi:hypothetical protein
MRVQLPLRLAQKEALVHRLDHIFGIDLGAEPVIEPGPRQGNQASGKALKDLGGGGGVTAPQLGHDSVE